MNNARFRQGDVNLEPCLSIPDGAKRLTGSDDLILAFGEATGHHHRLMPRNKKAKWKGKPVAATKDPDLCMAFRHLMSKEEYASLTNET